ncbi:hypothetical protein AXG89_08125 [Burkholderia sp. PAMC 26561]|nr:hypothetical protein AXG89_08125 [Burkholderia sp. PAMC 26561]
MALLMLTGLLKEMRPGFRDLRRFRRADYERTIKELKHERLQAQQLAPHSIEILEAADKRLSIRIERIKQRMDFFVGGTDKAALFGVFGLGWLAVKEASSKEIGHFIYLYVGVAAFASGIMIGAVMFKLILKHVAYQRDILALAIRSRSDKVTIETIVL